MSFAAEPRARATPAERLHIGTSGWVYPHWRGVFYPSKLPQRDWLDYYQRYFDTVEVNATFYRLPRPQTCAGWAQRSRSGFRLALKGSRYITHIRRLVDVRDPVARFFDCARLLGEHLGPVLWQLPPSMAADTERLRRFVSELPADVSHAFEFRNASWFTDATYDVLSAAGCSLCLYDMLGRETPHVLTHSTVYIRFHGPAEPYAGSYGGRLLKPWAERIRGWLTEGREVWAYFNNDINGHAVDDARRLAAMVQAVRPAWPRASS